jgi:hypothetical protein
MMQKTIHFSLQFFCLVGALPSKIDALAKGSGPVDYTRYVKRY